MEEALLRQSVPWDPEVKIDGMREEDLEQILGLEKSFFLTPWSKESFLSAIRDPKAINLICKYAGKVIGYVTSFMVLDEAYITNLLVDRRHRRKGRASVMLRVLIEKVAEREGRHVFLEVKESNSVAITFYKKFHFKVIGLRENYYSDTRENALLMELSLAE